MLKPSPRRKPTRVWPNRSAASTARSDGADTAQTIGMPATAAFWTISRLTRPLTSRTTSFSGSRPPRTAQPDELVERVVPPDVLAHGEQPPVRLEQSGGMEPAGRLEHALGLAQRSGQAEDHGAIDDWRAGGIGSQRTAISSSEALPQIPQLRRRDEMALGDRRGVEGAHEPDDDRVLRLGERRRVAGLDGVDVVVADQPLGAEEPDRQLDLGPRRPHRDRDRHRLLPGPGGADLERLFADERVVARLGHVATDRQHPRGGDVPDGQVGQVRPRRPRAHRGWLIGDAHPARRSRNRAGAIGRRQCVELIACL